MALEMLALEPGDSVLDVACGPGNFTRAFARESGDGLVVGLDASRTMLEQAIREPNPPNVRYVRADAAALPFPDRTFDAVCCFAALYFIEEPMRAIDEIVRVLAPGGRVALLSSVARGALPAGVTDAVVRRLSGTRVFGPDELTGALRDRGLTDGRPAAGRLRSVRVGSSPLMNGSGVTGSRRRRVSVTVMESIRSFHLVTRTLPGGRYSTALPAVLSSPLQRHRHRGALRRPARGLERDLDRAA